MTRTQESRSTTEADFAPREGVNVDELLEVLSDERRRRVVSYLRGADDPVELAELSEGVATREPDREADHGDDVRISLHHVHLPKLAAIGVLDYDGRTRTIRRLDPVELERLAALADELRGGLR